MKKNSSRSKVGCSEVEWDLTKSTPVSSSKSLSFICRQAPGRPLGFASSLLHSCTGGLSLDYLVLPSPCDWFNTTKEPNNPDLVLRRHHHQQQQSAWMTVARQNGSFHFEVVVHLLSERKLAGWGIWGSILFLGVGCGWPSQLGSPFHWRRVCRTWRSN